MRDNKKLLFVCLGNICRSPAAEGVMSAKAAAAGRSAEFEIDSAGIGGWHVGQLPDSRMRRRGALRGYRFDSHARQFGREDFSRFDHIYVMDNENYRAITSLAADEDERRKVEMLSDYLTTHDSPTIPDPYYGTEKDFDYALDLIEEACDELLRRLG